jgi:ABC-type transporter Mla subunit MlaD
MGKKLGDWLVALAVIGASAVLLWALTSALSKRAPAHGAPTVEIDFSDVAGIRVHSEVRFAGAPAGSVIQIRTLAPDERSASPAGKSAAVRVTVAIDPSHPPIPGDAVASVGADTLLGEKYVAFSAGTPDAPALKAGSIIAGRPGLNIDALASSLTPLIENADKTVASLKGEVDRLLPELRQLVASVGKVAGTADTLLTHADQFLGSNEGAVKTRLEELGRVLLKADAVAAEASKLMQSGQELAAAGTKLATTGDGLVGGLDRDLDARMKELGVVLQNLKVATTYSKALLEQLGGKPSRLIWDFGKPRPLPSEQEILDQHKPLPATRPR